MFRGTLGSSIWLMTVATCSNRSSMFMSVTLFHASFRWSAAVFKLMAALVEPWRRPTRPSWDGQGSPSCCSVWVGLHGWIPRAEGGQRTLDCLGQTTIFIWALDFMVQGADWTIYLTAAAVVAYASVSVFGRPTIKDASTVHGWIARSCLVRSRCSGCGRWRTSLSGHHPCGGVADNGDALGMLWWRTAALFLVIFFIDMAWRLRLLHGGLTPKH